MHLLFVADGPRDEVVVPELVKNILGTPFELTFKAWKSFHLNRGSGYKKRLKLALLQARDENLDGVVATLDRDNAKTGERLSELKEARTGERNSPDYSHLSTVVGEANPHLEAWLLDDPKAIRDVLGIDGNTEIPRVTSVDPKSCLNDLIDESDRSERRMELLPEIAKRLEADRCVHGDATGFTEFVSEVRAELTQLLRSD